MPQKFLLFLEMLCLVTRKRRLLLFVVVGIPDSGEARLKQGSHLAELEPRVVASRRDLMTSSFIIKTYFLISRIQFLISRNPIPDITKSNS